jgi:lambda family phage portal protein
MPGTPGFKHDEKAQKFIEMHWKIWSETPEYVDTTKRKTIHEIDRLCVKNWKRVGEYFILLDTGAPNPYGISLRIIRAEAIDHKYNADLSNGRIIRCGIEFDELTMEPLAYHLTTRKEYGEPYYSGGAATERISVDRIIHGFTQEEEDQARGVTHGHAVINTLKMIEDFNEAELVISLDEACTTRTYYAPAGRQGEVVNITTEEAGQLIMPKERGQAEVLPAGWESKIHTPQHPNREVTAFKEPMLRDFSCGVNLEHANCANSWAGVSFSSVRAGTISERDFWKMEQDHYIAQCKRIVFKAWLWSFLNQSISGEYPASKYDKFSQHQFTGRRWGWVDPIKDAKAAKVLKDEGWKTDTQIAADYGEDFDDNIEEIKRIEPLKKGTSLEFTKKQEVSNNEQKPEKQ